MLKAAIVKLVTPIRASLKLAICIPSTCIFVGFWDLFELFCGGLAASLNGISVNPLNKGSENPQCFYADWGELKQRFTKLAPA